MRRWPAGLRWLLYWLGFWGLLVVLVLVPRGNIDGFLIGLFAVFSIPVASVIIWREERG